MTLTITNALLIPVADTRPDWLHGWLTVGADGRITGLGTGDPPASDAEVLDFSGLFAHPYFLEGGSRRDGFVPGVGIPADYWGTVWTDGGLASTATDMARFGDALFRGRLLRRETLRAGALTVLGGLTLTDLLRAQEGAGGKARPGKAKHEGRTALGFGLLRGKSLAWCPG